MTILVKMSSKDMARKILFHELGVLDMFETGLNGFRKSILTILETFWTLLSDIVVILRKIHQPPPKTKLPGGRLDQKKSISRE